MVKKYDNSKEDYKNYIKKVAYFVTGCVYANIMKCLMEDIHISSVRKYIIALLILLIVWFAFRNLNRVIRKKL